MAAHIPTLVAQMGVGAMQLVLAIAVCIPGSGPAAPPFRVSR